MDHEESRGWTVNQWETTRTAKEFSIYLSNKCYSCDMFLPEPQGKWNDDISSEEHLQIRKSEKE